MNRALIWSSPFFLRQRLGFWTLHLLLCLLQSAVSQERKVYAALGSEVTLPCRTDTPDEIQQITWEKQEEAGHITLLTYREDTGPLYQTPYKRRVSFLGDGHRNGSIQILNVTLADEGVFKCIFTRYPSGPIKYEIRLSVEVFPDVHVVPAPGPVVVGCLEKIIGICIAGAAKPPAVISWRTGDLPYRVEENVMRHDNGTVTTSSELKMIPESKINGLNVTCVILQENGMSDVPTERTLTIQNIHYAPASVEVYVRSLDNGSIQLSCSYDASPPPIKVTWQRKEDSDSETGLDLGSGRLLARSDLLDGVYTCEVENILGKSSGSLYLYRHQGLDCSTYPYITCIVLLIITLLIIVSWKYWIKKKKMRRNTS